MILFGDGYGYIMGLVDRINFDELQISQDVINIVKNSMASFFDQASIWLTNFLTSMLSMISSVTTVGIYTVITILATYFICADKIYILDQIEHHFPKEWVKKLSKNIHKITKMLGGYLKAQAILIGINFLLVLIGLVAFDLFGLNVGYPVMMALLIAFSDALPILGSGTVILPWAVICGTQGNLNLAIALVRIICSYINCKTIA